ncbi:dihydrofolate reductase family protein [Nakamurella sp.]|uniref:dihydrofolate reductase family protein n=1 Tax=Nakamurella sp. TaxID=1869182 RepID=UPI003B3A5726
MRTLAVTQNVTLDGAVEMLGDWFDPQAGAADADQAAAARGLSAACDAILLGRRTFEDFRGYWPRQTDDRTGVTDELNRIRKYVVSGSMTDPQWANSTVLPGDPIEAVAQLKRGPGRDIVVTGSIRLSHALFRAGLVDRIDLWTFPAVQGRGRRLFPDGWTPDRIRLLDARPFRSGVVLTRYAVR